MKAVIIYKSKTGFTKKYAEWIADELKADMVPYEKRQQIDFTAYDTVIYGGGFHAGMISGLPWFKNQLSLLDGKKLVVFATGATPADSEEVPKAFAQNFTEDEQKRIQTFYMQSGLCYEKMSLGAKLMMAVFRFMLKKTQGDESEAYKMVQKSYDISSEKYILPLIEYLNK